MANYRRFFRRFLGAMGLQRKKTLPRTVTMRALVSDGCRFEITTRIEVYRVERYGGEEEFARLILDELRSTDVLYDIGACVGLIAVHAACKGVSVVAFEPDPSYRSRLETNLRLNGLDNVQVVSWALSDTPGEAILFTDGVDGKSPSLCQVGERGQTSVRTDTIDNALKRNEMPYPNVLKMDIEGAEILAMRGMQGLLDSLSAPRTIFIEIHPVFLSAFESSEQEVVGILESHGYRLDYRVQRSDQVHCIFRKQAPNQRADFISRRTGGI